MILAVLTPPGSATSHWSCKEEYFLKKIDKAGASHIFLNRPFVRSTVAKNDQKALCPDLNRPSRWMFPFRLFILALFLRSILDLPKADEMVLLLTCLQFCKDLLHKISEQSYDLVVLCNCTTHV